MLKLGKMKPSYFYLRQIVLPTLLIACFGLFMTVVVQRITEDQRRKTTDIVSLEVTEHLEEAIVNADRTLGGIMGLWLASKEVTPEEFRTFASSVYGDRKEIVALEWVDPDNIVRYVYPLEGENLKAVDLDNNKYPNRLAPILRAKEIRSLVMTTPILLAQGYPGTVIYEPIFRDGEYRGAAVGVLRFDALLAEFEKNLPFSGYDIVFGAGDRLLRTDGRAIYTTDGRRLTTAAGDATPDPSAPRIDAASRLAAKSLVFADMPWMVYVTPRDRSLPAITVMSALVSSAVIVLAFLFLNELRRTRDALERTLSRERDFASLVSHQLRAPLTELNWMIDVASDADTPPPERATTLADMRKIVRQSVRTITELLHISRIERGVMEVKMEETTIATIVDDVLMPLREAAKARGVQFKLDVPTSLTANVDAPKLVEALRNVADNAIKYGSSGGTVQISARRTDGAVSISVADRGTGIPEDIRGKIFDKASAFSKKGTTEGAGLGLYLSKNLVELMGGTIRFETSPGGTTFVITVPAAKPEKEDA